MKKLKNKWSYEYDKCVKCDLTKYKHYCHGVCEGCRKKEYYQRVKNTEEYKKRQWLNSFKYRHSKKFKNKLKNKLYKERSFEKFIKSEKKLRFNKGLEIVINGKRTLTPIKPPSNTNSVKDQTASEIEIFKKVFLRSLAKPKSYPQVTL